MNEKLIQLMSTYKDRGVLKGITLLLPPDVAFQLSEDLLVLGIPIMGLYGWVYVSSDDRRIKQDLTIEFYVGDDVMYGNNPVSESVAKVQAYLKNQLPADTPLVSFTLDIPLDWQLFPPEPGWR